MKINMVNFKVRRKQLLGIHEYIVKHDVYRGDKVYLGLRSNWDEYPDETTISERDWYWLRPAEEFNWFIASQAGSLKSVLISRVVPYFYHQKFKMCITEQKQSQMLNMANPAKDISRLHRAEKPIGLPVKGYVPNYVPGSLKDIKVVLDKVNEEFEQFSLNIGDFQEIEDVITLLGSSEKGAIAIINRIEKGMTNFQEILEDIQSPMARDSIHFSTKQSLVEKMQYIIKSKIFDNKPHPVLPLKELWREGKIPIICFFMKNVDFQKVVVAKLLAQQWNLLYDDKKRNKVLNIWDDCQNFFDNNIINSATFMVIRTMLYGRTYGFRNIFTTQYPQTFSKEILDNCSDSFIGYLRNYSVFDETFGYDIVRELKFMREEHSEKRMGGYTIQNVPYMHIPKNISKREIFFPANPQTDYFGVNKVGGEN